MTFNDLISVCTQIRVLGLCVVLSLSACSGFEKVLRTDIELGMAVDELKSELEDFKLIDECEKIFQPLHTPPLLNEGGFLKYSGISFLEDYRFKPMTYILLRNGVVVQVIIVGGSSSNDIDYLYERAYQDLTNDLGNEKYSFGGYRYPVPDSSILMALGIMIPNSYICDRFKVWNGANETEYSEYNNIQVVLATLKKNSKRHLYLSYEYFPDKLDYEALSTGKWKYTSYVNGKITKVKCIYPNFAVAYTEEYTDGKVNGEVVRYYEDGSRQAVTLYVSGNKQGKETQWRKDGSLLQVDSYERGVHVDSTIVYYEEGMIKEVTLYKDGEPTFSRGYHKNGAKESECEYTNGKMSGLKIGWYENGQKRYEIEYADGVKNGKETDWYENGKIWVTFSNVNGKQNGLYTRYYDNGQKMYTIMIVDGESNGIQEGWYESGKKKYETVVVNDKQNGTRTEYYPTGEKHKEITYANGKIDGKYVEYHENGNIKEKGEFKNYKYSDAPERTIPVGFWVWYDEDGNRTITRSYNQFGEVTDVHNYAEERKRQKIGREWAFSSIGQAAKWLDGSVWVYDNGKNGTWNEKLLVAFTQGRYEVAKMVGGRMLNEYKMRYDVTNVSVNRITIYVRDAYGNGGNQLLDRTGVNSYINNGKTYKRK